MDETRVNGTSSAWSAQMSCARGPSSLQHKSVIITEHSAQMTMKGFVLHFRPLPKLLHLALSAEADSFLPQVYLIFSRLYICCSPQVEHSHHSQCKKSLFCISELVTFYIVHMDPCSDLPCVCHTKLSHQFKAFLPSVSHTC